MKLTTLLLALLIAAPANPAYARRYSDAELATMFVSREPPYYPLALRQRAITGSGTFRLYIDEQGRVTKIGVLMSTGNKELDASALHALVRWRAKPGAEREVDQPVTFTIRAR